MASSLNGTGLTFSTGQTLNSVPVTSLNGQTDAITNTNLYSIGSYVVGRPKNATQYSVNSTIAGSSLYAASTGTYTNGVDWYGYDGFQAIISATLVNTGTWRCVSPCVAVDGFGLSGLWVRIS